MMEIYLRENKVRVDFEDGSFIQSSSVKDLLLLKILEKLDDIENRLIDIDSAVDPR